jgi:hypothetical protein
MGLTSYCWITIAEIVAHSQRGAQPLTPVGGSASSRTLEPLGRLQITHCVHVRDRVGQYGDQGTRPGSIPGGIPTDPTIYRFYEMLQVYGTTLKALVHEQFGDRIISAINFKLDVRKVADPEGGERAVITLDGKYLPTKPF